MLAPVNISRSEEALRCKQLGRSLYVVRLCARSRELVPTGRGRGSWSLGDTRAIRFSAAFNDTTSPFNGLTPAPQVIMRNRSRINFCGDVCYEVSDNRTWPELPM